MDRTVPSSANEEIQLYLRTYYSLLRSTTPVQIKALIEAHKRIKSALHPLADERQPDLSAFIYAVLRLPAEIDQIRLMVLGQSARVFAQHGYPEVETWQPVTAPGRRRRAFFDGAGTLAVYIASRSDIDDLIPILTAYQIERDKLQQILETPAVRKVLHAIQTEAGGLPEGPLLVRLAHATDIAADDLERLGRIWGDQTAARLLAIGQRRHAFTVRALASSLIDYKRATRRWWNNIEKSTPETRFDERPVYFVSSNTHSLANLFSGYAVQEEATLQAFIQTSNQAELRREYEDILEENVPSNWQNFLYYVLKKYEATEPSAVARRLVHERENGIVRVNSAHAFEIDVQVITLNQLRPDCLDARLRVPGIEAIAASDAVVVNIDYPLGLAAYQVLSEVARNAADIRGAYIMGKAATLNGRIGDIMIPNVVHDEHSLNTYLFDNCFTADDVAPYLVYSSVLDNQKAITVPGTFLQNESYMSVFYQEGYTIMEMEAGPYLSSIYEMVRPTRHPHNEIVNLHRSPFPIGMLHYASDTPFSKGKNLGAHNLSYFGMDPTYATSVAIGRAILTTELAARRRPSDPN